MGKRSNVRIHENRSDNGTFAWGGFEKPRPRAWRIYIPLALAFLILITIALLNLRGA